MRMRPRNVSVCPSGSMTVTTTGMLPAFGNVCCPVTSQSRPPRVVCLTVPFVLVPSPQLIVAV